MGFTGAHMLYYVLDIFILALYLLSHVCALLEYTYIQLTGSDEFSSLTEDPKLGFPTDLLDV